MSVTGFSQTGTALLNALDQTSSAKPTAGRPLIPVLGCFYLVDRTTIRESWVFAAEDSASKKSIDCCNAFGLAAQVPDGQVLVGVPLFRRVDDSIPATQQHREVLQHASWALYKGLVRKVRSEAERSSVRNYCSQARPGDDSYCTVGLCPFGKEHRQSCSRIEFMSTAELVSVLNA